MTALLADAGVPVVVVARRRDRLTELARSHQGIEVLAADLTTKRGCDTVADRLADDDRPIDLLVNNAGFGSSGEFVTIAPDRLDDEISLNVRALTTLSRAVLPGMVERRRGWLLNVELGCRLPVRSRAGGVRGDEGIRHEPLGEPARGAARHRRPGHGAVPGT